MKKMKKMKFKILLLAVLIGGFSVLQNCSSDDDPAPVVINKTALQGVITTVKSLLSTTTEGTAVGSYTVGSQAILQTALDSAQAIADSTTSTQAQVDAAVVSLNSAITIYNAAVIAEIAPENLVGHWKFDDCSGTTVADVSGNNFTGTFGAETMLDASAENPVWTADRFGTANKALLFDKGAKVTVPYSGAINPGEISISVWIRIDEQRNNRFMGLHSWHGYKFEVENGNKPFMTVNNGAEFINKDITGASTPLVLNDWYHLVVTFGNDEMSFYINGVHIITHTDVSGAVTTTSGHDLVFGVDSSQYAATDVNYNAGTDFTIPGAWGSYLHGALDEVRIYNTVLTASQVTALNNAEKP